jgi:hypothetical protein
MSVEVFSENTLTRLAAVLPEHGGLIAERALRVEPTRDPNPVTQNATLRLTCSPSAQGARTGSR